MPDEGLRSLLLSRVDALLSRWLISAEDRRLLYAMRGYVAEMDHDDLERFRSYLSRAYTGEEYGGPPADPDSEG